MQRRLRFLAARALLAAASALIPRERESSEDADVLPPGPVVTMSAAAREMVEEGERMFREEAEKKAKERASAHLPEAPRPGSARARLEAASRRHP